MPAKSILKGQSKTINVNAMLIGLATMLPVFGIELPDEVYKALLAGIPLANIILRLVTKSAVTLTSTPVANNRGRLKLALLPALVVLAVVIACATASNMELKQSHCDGGPSIILDTIPNAEMAHLILKGGEFEILRNNPQMVPGVKAMFADARKRLKRPGAIITGQDAVAYLAKNVEIFKSKDGSQRLFYLSQLAGKIKVPDPLTPCDRKLLLIHIDNVEAEIFPYVGQ